ncbi:unnamed protein product [Lupinus luteus]|uniref:RNase H type-1 domain-containing protein n=1 Tax=Lupinus luteus TaxID=3873 RepID=A0AAV1W9F6_LUPLU
MENFIGCFATYYNIQNSLFAKLLTAIKVVQLAKAKGWLCIWLECDSKLVVDIFHGSMEVPWRLRNLWNHCRRLLGSMLFKVSHIFREGNQCADLLANHGVLHKLDTWWNAIPNFLLNEFNRNRFALPSYRFRNL